MGKLQNPKKLGTDNIDLSRIQDYIERSIGGIISSEILNGTLAQNVSLTSGLNEVSHKLGRKPRGWIVVRKRANVDIWDEQDGNTKPQLTLKLQASGSVSVDLWIF